MQWTTTAPPLRPNYDILQGIQRLREHCDHLRRIQKRNWRRDKNRGQSSAPKISIQARDFLERLKEWYMVSDDLKFANGVRAPRCLVVSVLLPYFSDDPCLNPAAFYYDWIVCLILTGKSFANVMPVIQNWICVLFFTTTPNRRKISTY